MNKQIFLKIQSVCERTSFCRAQIYKLMKLGEFPSSYKLTEKSVAWRSDEIEKWIESRVQSHVKGVK